MLHQRGYAMRVLVLCLLASLAAGAIAQTPKPAPKPATLSTPAAAAKPAASTASAHFSAAGLNNEDDFLRIYSGDFQSVRLDPASAEFMAIISSYMNDYSRDCRQFLPPNKVEITKQVCAETSTPVNGYGAPGRSLNLRVLSRPSAPASMPTRNSTPRNRPSMRPPPRKCSAACSGMMTGKGGSTPIPSPCPSS